MQSAVVLINLFEVPLGMEDAFVEWWKKSTEALKKEPGFIDAKLHRRLTAGQRFEFVNVAHWETAESLNIARNKHHDILNSLVAGKGNPALYRIVWEA